MSNTKSQHYENASYLGGGELFIRLRKAEALLRHWQETLRMRGDE
jgi:hypothetical protein